MFNIAEWLNEPITVRRQYCPPETLPRHEYLSFLISANGGLSVTGWGIMSNGGVGGHQQGLEQNDALTLLELSGFINGLMTAGMNFREAFDPHFTAYRARWEAKERERAEAIP